MPGADYYRPKAAEYREMARDCDPATAASLIMLAESFEEEARRLEPDAEPPLPAT